MHPRVRRNLALLRQLDHVNRRRMSRRPARPAFQRRLKFPDRCIARTADMFIGGAFARSVGVKQRRGGEATDDQSAYP
jgi:hypothetical protein